MKFKKLVTVIVAAFAICVMFGLPCEASATTKATTKEDKAEKREYTASELRYMTSIIYCEARGESFAGQKAVGIVVMNRMRSDLFPNTVKEVIYQRGQFSPVRNGYMRNALKIYDKQKKNKKWSSDMKSCRKAAIQALEGSTVIKVDGKKKQMEQYLFFSRYVRGAKYKLGGHQFK
ncbi:MAG: cell wall hydrolase [Eubacteriales bacterium]|nr:cell wall hydrolase [Eubacteriales bacterium]